MIFFGASGHAKVVIEAWLASGGRVSAVFDDEPGIKEVLTYPVSSRYKPSDFEGKDLCISIGSNITRKKIAGSFSASFKSVIHPNVVISNFVVVGSGTVAMARVMIKGGSGICHYFILNKALILEQDWLVLDIVLILPHCTLW